MYDQREEQRTAQNAKIAADYRIEGIPAAPQGACGQSVHFASENCCETVQSYSLPSLREEAEKQVGYHRTQAEKQDQAAAFFRENPAFDLFIRLIRSGAIQI